MNPTTAHINSGWLRMVASTVGRCGVAATVLAGFVAGCGSKESPSPSAQSAGQLTLYSAQHEQTTKAVVSEFTKETGIKVNVVSAAEDETVAKIEQEGAKSPADVVYTENSPWLAQLDKQSLLAKVDGSTLSAVPHQDSPSDGTWVGVSARISGITYNTAKVRPDQLPKSIMELADPAWKDRIEIAPSETDFWPLVSSVLHAYGPDKTVDWLKGLKANAGNNDNVPSNETLAADISQGNTDLGVLNQYYYYRLKTEVGDNAVSSNFAFFAPHDPGYVENISGAGILASSKNQADAQKFLAFLTSRTGQTILATSDSFEYPIVDGVAANPQLPPLSSLAPNAFSISDLGTGEDAKTMLQQAQLL